MASLIPIVQHLGLLFLGGLAGGGARFFGVALELVNQSAAGRAVCIAGRRLSRPDE